MSLVGQVLCQRRLIGAWATWMVGSAAAAAAPVAPTAAFLRKSRRDDFACWDVNVFFAFMPATREVVATVKPSHIAAERCILGFGRDLTQAGPADSSLDARGPAGCPGPPLAPAASQL